MTEEQLHDGRLLIGFRTAVEQSSRSALSSRSSSPSRLPWDEEEFAAFMSEEQGRFKEYVKALKEQKLRAALKGQNALIKERLRAKQLTDHSDHPSDGE